MDGYGVERMDMELNRMGMELKGWVWILNGEVYGVERMDMELKGWIWN